MPIDVNPVERIRCVQRLTQVAKKPSVSQTALSLSLSLCYITNRFVAGGEGKGDGGKL